MIYQIGDKFLYKSNEHVVVYINAGKAWLAVSDEPWVSVAVIEGDGKDTEGNKAVSVTNQECLAV